MEIQQKLHENSHAKLQFKQISNDQVCQLGSILMRSIKT